MAPFWLTFLVWAAIFVSAELLRPKPKFENARPAGLGEFQFPTATEGRAVPILWGKVLIKGPNVVWYGNVRNRPIKKNVKTGLFSSEDITTGYRYYAGMQFALCRGPVDYLTLVKTNNKNILIGNTTDGQRRNIAATGCYGGEEFGSGGVSGVLAFHAGTTTQAVDTYLSTRQVPTPAYRRTCYCVFEGGYIGTSPNIQPWEFEVQRIPDGLGMASYDPGSENPNTYDCNPMNVLYEILTDTDWGLAIPISEIDTANFRAAGSTLAAEGNGFSMLLDGEIEAEELINEVQRQIDGQLYFDRTVGLWRIALARDDYTPGTLPIFDESNINELIDYTRQTWDETSNQVRVSFIDRSDGYKQTFALAQDIANNLIQGGNVTADLTYPGVKDATLANQLAWRDIATLSYPLAKINFKVNRSAYDFVPGTVFKFSWDRLGVSEVVFRVSQIKYGTIEDGKITIFAIEDIFSTGTGVFGDPIGSGWADENDSAVAVDADDTLVFEAPRQMVAQDPQFPTLQPRIWMGARDPGGGTINFQSYVKFGSSRPISGDFVVDTQVTAFLVACDLETSIDAYGTANWPDTSAFIRIDNVSPDDITEFLGDGDASLVTSLVNLIYIGGEFIGFEDMVDVGGGVYRLENIYRGLFNSYPKPHTAGDRIWFIGQSGGALTFASVAAAHDECDLQLRSQDKEGEVSEASTPTEEVTLSRVWKEPLPPRYAYLHGSLAPSSVSLDVQYLAGTGLTGDDARAVWAETTARAWRVDDILDDTNLAASSPSYTSDSPAIDFQLVLDPSGTPINVPAITASDPEDPEVYILRNSIIEAVGANADIPTTGKIVITPEHQPSGEPSVITCTNPLEYEFTITSSLIGQAIRHGGIVGGDVASTAVVYGETGSYSFDIHTALPTSGRLQARLNGGSWVTVVAGGSSTGNLSVTASDSVELRFDNAPANDQFFDVTGPTSETGYGVLLA